MRMKRVIWTTACAAVVGMLLSTATPTLAMMIYESATTSGGTDGYLVGGPPPGFDQYLGVRFNLTSPVTTDTIGGRFHTAFPGVTLFGAIVALTDLTDFPDSVNLSTPDVLAVAVFPVGVDADYSAPISATLVPGDYALVFGSELFGASGFAGVPSSNTDIGTPSYFFKPSGTSFYFDFGGLISGTRFFLLGSQQTAVPEPSTWLLLGSGLACLAFWRRKRQG